jgi:hypothetical protein
MFVLLGYTLTTRQAGMPAQTPALRINVIGANQTIKHGFLLKSIIYYTRE